MRTLTVCLGVLLMLFTLAACEGDTGDTTEPLGTNGCLATDQTVTDNQTADLGCVKVTFTKSDYSASQLTLSVRVENTGTQPLTMKQSLFDVQDASKTNALPTTCTRTGGKGGFSGDLAPGDKAETDLCWFLVGATPPIKVVFNVPGSGSASYTVATQ